MAKENEKRLVAYRNIDGYELQLWPKKEPTDKYVMNIGKAHYVRCPETDHLRSVLWCNGCEFDGGREAGGQICKSTKPYVCNWYDKRKVYLAYRIDVITTDKRNK